MLSGGKLIDEGLYGCIFSPPLQCKDKPREINKPSENLTYSKLIVNKYAEREFEVGKLISRIPLWKNYFVVSESICSPAVKQKENNLDECGVIDDEKISNFKILKMSFGGQPLSRYRFNLQTFNFMDFVKHMIEGCALLNLFGVVHRDIHQGNILVDENQVPRIIDFNLSIFTQQNITSHMLKHQYNYNIAQEPPDSTLVNAIVYGYNPSIVIQSLIYKKSIIKKIRNILGISQDDMYRSLHNFYDRAQEIQKGDDVEWFHKYWRTIDSWAIGINIIDMISRFSLSSEFSNNFRKHRVKLMPVLKRLCAVNPNDRIDCVQALNYLDPNHFIIRRYSKAWLAKVGDGNI